VATFACPAARLALAFDQGETFLERLDAHPEQAPVGLQLLFARTAQADAALLALQVSPTANQPRRKVFQLGEFDLQLAFMALGAQRKDIEDQGIAVHHTALQLALKVALLNRGELVVEQHQIGLVFLAYGTDFFDLAAAGEEGRIGCAPLAAHHGQHLSASALGKQRYLVQSLDLTGFAKIELNDDGPVTARGPFKHSANGRLRGRVQTRCVQSCLSP